MGFKNWLKQNNFSLLFVGALALLFPAFIYTGFADKYFFGAVGALITLYIGMTRHQLNHDQMVMDLFKHYNGRYDEKLNDLFNRIRDDESYKLISDDIELVIDYLNLCAEEYYWYKKGRIPQKIWESWERGIRKNFKIPQVAEIAAKEKGDSGDTYYGFFDDLEWSLPEKSNSKKLKS